MNASQAENDNVDAVKYIVEQGVDIHRKNHFK